MATTPDLTNAHLRYPALDPSLPEFRLFRFHGRDASGQLHGRLRTVSLERHIKFIALSYEWGNDASTNRILVNDRPFYVRSNLFSFLGSLAGHKRLPHGIFIDALCVNQADLAERSNQVRLMSDIYSSATEVRAWLGPLPAWWTAEPQLSDLFSTVEKREWGNFMLYLRTHREPEKPVQFTVKALTDHFAASGFHNLTIIAARVAAQRSFWGRLWIVQEVLLARKLTLQLGYLMLSPQTVLKVSRAMRLRIDGISNGLDDLTLATPVQSSDHDLADGHRFRDAAAILRRKYEGSTTPGSSPLAHLMVAFSTQRCREPRDHVFGLLGLSNSVLKADYRISLTQLYLYCMIEAHQQLSREGLPSAEEAAETAASPLTSSFGWETSDITIHLLTQQAFQCELGALGQSNALFPLWSQSSLVGYGSWPTSVRWVIEAVEFFVLIMQPFGWSLLTHKYALFTSSQLLCGPTAYAYLAQSLLLMLYRWLNIELAMPDGQVRSISAWYE